MPHTQNSGQARRIVREIGAHLDDGANAAHAPLISTDTSKVAVAVEPTNEEWIAAVHARDLLAG